MSWSVKSADLNSIGQVWDGLDRKDRAKQATNAVQLLQES